jgi:hypothetical protein
VHAGGRMTKIVFTGFGGRFNRIASRFDQAEPRVHVHVRVRIRAFESSARFACFSSRMRFRSCVALTAPPSSSSLASSATKRSMHLSMCASTAASLASASASANHSKSRPQPLRRLLAAPPLALHHCTNQPAALGKSGTPPRCSMPILCAKRPKNSCTSSVGAVPGGNSAR